MTWTLATTHPALNGGPKAPCQFLFDTHDDILRLRDRLEGRPLWDAAGEVVQFLVAHGLNLGLFRIVYWDRDEGLWHGIRVIPSRLDPGYRFAGLYHIGAASLPEAEAKARLVNFRQSRG